jgi:uncharacterized protein YdaU (DUF1376 family)
LNYYERHLGDYAKDTAHLSMLEHGAYGLLMDRYYATEQGIPADQAHRVARARSKEERAAVDAVLAEFFVLVNSTWTKNRIEEEIAKAALKINSAKENGRKGGRPKNPAITQQKPSGLSLGSENETQDKALQTPDTKHQTPKKKTSSSSGSRRCPDDFEVTESMRSKAESDSPGVDIDRETTKFRDWEFAKARSDWPAAWRNWIREAADRLSQRSLPSTRPPPQSFRERELTIAEDRMGQLTGGLLGRKQAPKPTQEVFDVTPLSLD